MRLRIPPFLPPYAVLFLVIAYAVGALWLGMERLDAITRLGEAAAQNAATMHDLQALLGALDDIETAERGFALTADNDFIDRFERGRRRVPVLLAGLRDNLRDNPSELALIEQLVPLIAERTTISATGIERKRSAPDQPYATGFGARDKETSAQIRVIVAALEDREQDQLMQDRQQFARTIRETRWGVYVMAGLTLILLMALFLAVRRLRSFMPIVPPDKIEGVLELQSPVSSAAMATKVGPLLQDAALRIRLAQAAAPADTHDGAELRSLLASTERALENLARLAAGLDPSPPDERSAAHDLGRLAQAYSRPNGLTVKPTIDQSIKIADPFTKFVLYRSAEWAFEAITLRKRIGEVALHFASSGDEVVLRIQALTDDPNLPVNLTPREKEEAHVLQQSVASVGGTFVVSERPTGLSLMLTVPSRS
jgi:CHASE3 domain sensor protein